MTYEGITNFSSLTYFGKKGIESIPTTCRGEIPTITDDQSAGITSEPAFPGANISSVAIIQLIVAVQSSEYYTLVGRTMNATDMNYINVFWSFKIEWDIYEEFNKEYDPDVTVINDKCNDHKVIKWVSFFNDCISGTYGYILPLVYVLLESSSVPI